jgi:hypothetical protein
VLYSSIYQEIPLHSLEEFEQLAPEESKTGEVLADEHQLMLNRLSFELAERQRCVTIAHLVEEDYANVFLRQPGAA